MRKTLGCVFALGASKSLTNHSRGRQRGTVSQTAWPGPAHPKGPLPFLQFFQETRCRIWVDYRISATFGEPLAAA